MASSLPTESACTRGTIATRRGVELRRLLVLGPVIDIRPCFVDHAPEPHGLVSTSSSVTIRR